MAYTMDQNNFECVVFLWPALGLPLSAHPLRRAASNDATRFRLATIVFAAQKKPAVAA